MRPLGLESQGLPRDLVFRILRFRGGRRSGGSESSLAAVGLEAAKNPKAPSELGAHQAETLTFAAVEIEGGIASPRRRRPSR